MNTPYYNYTLKSIYDNYIKNCTTPNTNVVESNQYGSDEKTPCACEKLDEFYVAYKNITTSQSLTEYFNEYFNIEVPYSLGQIAALKKHCCKFVLGIEPTPSDYLFPFPDFMDCIVCPECTTLVSYVLENL